MPTIRLSAQAQAYLDRHCEGHESPLALAWQGAVWALKKSPELGKLMAHPFRSYDHKPAEFARNFGWSIR